jgi:hypothetical protein
MGAESSANIGPPSQEIFSLDSTESHHLFEGLTTSYYIPLEVWYIRTSVDRVNLPFYLYFQQRLTFDKAHRLSNADTSQSPATTTTPDDVFYILKLVISRLISTGSLTGLERTLEQLREVMERDYIGVIKKRLDDVYRPAGTSGTNVRGDKIERENRAAFIVRAKLSGFS